MTNLDSFMDQQTQRKKNRNKNAKNPCKSRKWHRDSPAKKQKNTKMRILATKSQNAMDKTIAKNNASKGNLIQCQKAKIQAIK